MYKKKYTRYCDLNIMDFKDEIDLLYSIDDQLEDGDMCVDIIADDITIRYLLSLAMSELDYAPRRINMEKDERLYCLELFDDGSLRVFLYDDCHNDTLQGTSIYLYQEAITQDIVEFALDFYDDSDVCLYGLEDEDDDFTTGDVTDLDIQKSTVTPTQKECLEMLIGMGVVSDIVYNLL